MQHLKKLNRILHYSDFHIEGIGLLLFVLGLHHFWIWALLGLYLYYTRKIIKISFFGVIALIIFTRFSFFISNEKEDSINQVVKVISIKKGNYQSTYTLDVGTYHVNLNSQHDQFEVGDLLYIRGPLFSYRKETIPHGFNAYDYYLSKNVKGFIRPGEVFKVDREFHMLSFRYELIQKLDNYESSKWMKSFIFGEDELEMETKDLFSNLGMIHLLQASGMHIFMLITIIRKIMFYLDIKKTYQYIVMFLVYVLFFYLHAFDIGITRLFIMFILLRINDYYEFRFSKLDLLQFTCMIMVIFNISLIYNVGFLMIYLILTTLYLLDPIISDKGLVEKRYIYSLSVMIIILPFQGKISMLTILLLPAITFILTGPLFISLLLGMIYPKIDRLNLSMFDIFQSFINQIDRKNVLIFLPSLPTYLIIIYFLCVFYVFSSSDFLSYVKRFMILGILFTIPIWQLKIDERIFIYFLDVGQGDTIFIQSSKCNILVDAYSNSLDFLHNKGIYTLDYLILTHSDDDHTKEAMNITQEIRVNDILISMYDYAHKPYKITPKRIKAYDQITCGSLKLDFLSPIKDLGSPNANSLVFKLYAKSKSILFTGDIEDNTEEILVSTFGDYLKSDVIKVPHHGSITSSSNSFISHVKPAYAIISLALFNQFQFPSDDVIHRYTMMGTKIYRTDTHGTIVYTITKKNTKWSFHLPF